jgi:succinate dehydrogenase / fumarate reductase, cytochrome b subunit
MPLPTLRTRPTSPHWQIYRWQIGSSLSILHRLTGIALALGLLALCYWLVSLAGGEKSYAAAARVFASPLGLLVLVSLTFAFLYHLLNGVRHLLWDAGYGFERAPRHASGWFALIAALFATLVIWALVWRFAS